jgi:hypothetical protein
LKIISILILSIILLLSSASPVQADAGEARHEEKEVDGYKVKLTFVEGDVQIGHNELNIQINDPQGQLVTNAGVTIIAELYNEIPTGVTSTGNSGMNMGSDENGTSPPEKPMMTVKADLVAGTNAGEYEGEVELEETGHWMITAVVRLQQQEKSVEFVVDLQKSGPNWYVLSGFFGVIVVIIVVGVLKKRKSKNVPMPEEVR